MQKVAIYGAGGHGKVVWEILTACGDEVVGFIDDNPRLPRLLGLPIEAIASALPAHDAAIIAIGDNRTRATIYSKVHAAGLQLTNAIHPSAVLSPRLALGKGVVIAPGVIINIDTHIGNNVILNTGSTIDHDCVIGDHVHIAPGSALGGGISIHEGAFLGLGTRVIPGRKIGAWSTVGAGGVVVHDVPANQLVVGVPARAMHRS